jgi:hypothetical protein
MRMMIAVRPTVSRWIASWIKASDFRIQARRRGIVATAAT